LVVSIFALFVSSAGAASLQTGVAEFEGTPADRSGLEAERIAASGSTYVLHWLRWDKVAPSAEPDAWNPTSPGDDHYDWNEVDQRVISARNAGLQPLLQIFGVPEWAQRCKAPPDLYVAGGAPCNPSPEDVADFTRAAAKRFSGTFGGLPRVKYWQILNEPNLSIFFNPQFNKAGKPVSPGLYRNILKKAYPAVKAGNPGNVVIAAGLAPFGQESGLTPLDFARRLFCLDKRNRPLRRAGACAGGVKLDAFDMHPYTEGSPDTKSQVPGNVSMGNLGELKSLLAAADRAKRIDGAGKRTPLWITEMSWDSKPPDPGGLPMRILTRWTAEAINRAWRVGVSKFFWYSLRDQSCGGIPCKFTTQSGLYFRGDSIEADRPKRSLEAFRFPVVAYSKRHGANYWGRTPTSERGLVILQFRRGGGWRQVGRARANGDGIFRGFIRSKALARKRGQIRAVYAGEPSVPFSLKPVKNFYQRIFG